MKKKVLFLNFGNYNLRSYDDTLSKKFTALSEFVDCVIVGKGDRCEYKYNALFCLLKPYSNKLFFLFWLLRYFYFVHNLIKKEKVDTIIAQSPGFDGLLAAFLKIINRKELIVEVHGDWIKSLTLYHNLPFPSIFNFLLTLIGKFSLEHADKIRIVSTATETQVKNFVGNKPLFKFPGFTNIDLIKDVVISYEPTILYAGWLYKLKGVHFLVKAFSKIQHKYPDYKLLIAGEGPYKKTLEELINNLQVKNVVMTGWLSQKKLIDHMSKCSCVVLPSLSEGLGRVLVEGAFLRKPLIGSDIDGIPDIIKDGQNGYLFKPGDINKLSQCIELIISNQKIILEFGNRAYELIKDTFSLESYFANYKEMIYSEIKSA